MGEFWKKDDSVRPTVWRSYTCHLWSSWEFFSISWCHLHRIDLFLGSLELRSVEDVTNESLYKKRRERALRALVWSIDSGTGGPNLVGVIKGDNCRGWLVSAGELPFVQLPSDMLSVRHWPLDF